LIAQKFAYTAAMAETVSPLSGAKNLSRVAGRRVATVVAAATSGLSRTNQ
jgi:hypothetical protein